MEASLAHGDGSFQRMQTKIKAFVARADRGMYVHRFENWSDAQKDQYVNLNLDFQHSEVDNIAYYMAETGAPLWAIEEMRRHPDAYLHAYSGLESAAHGGQAYAFR